MGKDIVLWGWGLNGKKVFYPLIQQGYNIISIIDSKCTAGNTGPRVGACTIPINSPSFIRKLDSSVDIFLTMEDLNISRDIVSWSGTYGISKERFVHLPTCLSYIELFSTERTNFIKDYASFVATNKLDGQVAECGVFVGNCAKFINRYFYGRKCYLFDTFESFSDKDIESEISLGSKSFINSSFCKNPKMFENTSPEYVMCKMTNPEKVEIRKGLVPETFKGIEEKFVFVNLDMDLYTPTLAALEFFWAHMDEGCILMHDYFYPSLPGIKKAVDDFEVEIHKTIPKLPIGDGCSIALIKQRM